LKRQVGSLPDEAKHEFGHLAEEYNGLQKMREGLEVLMRANGHRRWHILSEHSSEHVETPHALTVDENGMIWLEEMEAPQPQLWL
jgi:hypothetical protein